MEITFDGTDWSTPAACDWTCDPGRADTGFACVVPTVEDCVIDGPEQIEAPLGATTTLAGLVATSPAGQAPMDAYFCYLPADGSAEQVCVDARRDPTFLSGGTFDARYEADVAFTEPGDYVYLFGVDLGEDWSDCDLDGPVRGVFDPGRVSVWSLLPNGGFEDWPDGQDTPTHWKRKSGLGIDRAVSPRTGDVALALSRNSDDNQKVELTAARIDVEPATAYNITFHVLDDSSQLDARLLYRWYDDQGAKLPDTGTGTYSGEDPDWQEMSQDVLAPLDAAKLEVAIRVYAVSGAVAPFTDTVLLDDVSVSLLD